MIQSSVFEETYRHYLSLIGGVDPAQRAERLGGQADGDGVILPFLGRSYRISAGGIRDILGDRVSHAIKVLLSKYVLLCPVSPSGAKEWVSYRDFKDAAPFAAAFSTNAERSLAKHFSGRAAALKQACRDLNGRSPDIRLSYDVQSVFDVLPKVPVLLLFNDRDDEFSAQCSLLFERRAEDYLDMECLAIVGWTLSDALRQAAGWSGAALP